MLRSKLSALSLVAGSLALLSVLPGCTRKKKNKPPPPPEVKVEEPETMTAPNQKLVRRISGGELPLSRMVDPAAGLGWATYNVDLGSGRRLCGDNLAKSTATLAREMAIIDKQNYTLECTDLTCIAKKGQYRVVFVFRFKEGVKLDAVSSFMHPVPDDFLDVRTDAAVNATCAEGTFAALDPKAADYCQQACARTDTCGALKSLKHTVEQCVLECTGAAATYKVTFCDPFVKDCVGLTECITGKKVEPPPGKAPTK